MWPSFCDVTLKLAEPSVLKSRPSVLYGANLFVANFTFQNNIVHFCNCF